MTYVDPDSVHTPATGQVVPAFWGAVVRDDLEYLVNGPFFIGNSTFSAVESVSNGVSHVMDITVEQFDSDGMHSSITNTDRVTIQTDGKYLILVNIWWAADSTGVRSSRLRVNGDTVYVGEQHDADTVDVVTSSLFELDLTASDYVEPIGLHNQGTNINAYLLLFVVLWVSR